MLLPMQGSMLLALCLQGSFPALRSLSQAAAGDVYTPRKDTAWSAISWVTTFQTTSSLQTPHSEINGPAWAGVLRYSSQKAEGSCSLLFGVKRYIILKPTFIRPTPERCWTFATSPENEGCKPTSTYLKNSNIDLLLNSYMIIQKFLIIWSFA